MKIKEKRIRNKNNHTMVTYPIEEGHLKSPGWMQKE